MTKSDWAKLWQDFESQLDEYMNEWETSLQSALKGSDCADGSKSKPRQYPERKKRELTADEKQKIRERIERGSADIYALAREFDCSTSQVAGIKAAMSR
jgi:hypothetical protein